MKITNIETIRTDDRPSVMWVRVSTGDGLVGLGETWFGAATVEADIHDRIAPMLLGHDARLIDDINRLMTPYVGFCGTGAEMRALSAIDVALWDIAGKAASQPLCDLLGGRIRDRIPVYNTCAGPNYVSKTSDVRPGNFGLPDGTAITRFEDLDVFLNRADDLALELLESGIAAMKIWPFDFTAGAADGADISVADLNKALRPFERIRAAHGDRMRIKAELHGLWSRDAAWKICQALEPLEVDWVEDPVRMDRMGEMGELAQATTLPLAGGETLGGIGQIDDLITRGGVTVAIVDVTWGGGVTFGIEAAALAASHGRAIAFHDCSGPVTLAASSHLALACPNAAEQEFTRAFYHGWYGQFVTGLPGVERGMITVSDAPGHGIELAPDLARRDGVTVRASSA
ncbi:MAG TPA: mandelate racemase/muconate lactonizing enzyme family protein [Thermohalobaculum sp.]|nr:mandelate racemase/muconate lactonizing enzyme family protein [Thermohalobaculum sp.]